MTPGWFSRPTSKRGKREKRYRDWIAAGRLPIKVQLIPWFTSQTAWFLGRCNP